MRFERKEKEREGEKGSKASGDPILRTPARRNFTAKAYDVRGESMNNTGEAGVRAVVNGCRLATRCQGPLDALLKLYASVPRAVTRISEGEGRLG